MKGEQLALDSAVIKVIGIGNMGYSAIDYMRNINLEGVEFHCFIEAEAHAVIKGTDLLFLIADMSQHRVFTRLIECSRNSQSTRHLNDCGYNRR